MNLEFANAILGRIGPVEPPGCCGTFLSHPHPSFRNSRSVEIGLVIELHPHLLRHTFAHSYLEANPGDLVGLAQILGHSNLNTTKRYVQKTEGQLGEAVEKMGY